MTSLNKPIKAIAYTRISTKKQGETGNGLNLQMTRIDGFAQAGGYEIIRTFSDVHTGAGEDSAHHRRHLLKAMKLSREKKWPIIVDGLDRLSRNTKTVEEMIINGRLKVISAKNGEGATHAVIMGEAARAQEEVERISRTTKEGLRRARERGTVLGNTKNLGEAQQKGAASNKAKADQQTRELAPVVQDIRSSGMTMKEAIANELNLRGYRTARNERWNKDNVRRLLDRIDNLGELEKEQKRYQENPLYGSF